MFEISVGPWWRYSGSAGRLKGRATDVFPVQSRKSRVDGLAARDFAVSVETAIRGAASIILVAPPFQLQIITVTRDCGDTGGRVYFMLEKAKNWSIVHPLRQAKRGLWRRAARVLDLCHHLANRGQSALPPPSLRTVGAGDFHRVGSINVRNLKQFSSLDGKRVLEIGLRQRAKRPGAHQLRRRVRRV